MGWSSFRDKITRPARDVADVISFGHGEELEKYTTGEAQKDIIDKVSGTVSDIKSDITGETAADAAKQAATTAAQAQMEELEYYKEINKLPQQYKEEALTELRNLAFEPGAQENMIEKIKQTPMYQQVMGSRKAGEEAVMRAASTTGGLRSGNVQEALYDYNVNLENQALQQGYGQQMAGLQQLAGIPTNTAQIGQTIGDIGQTIAQGQLGAAQSRQQGTQNIANVALGIGGLLI